MCSLDTSLATTYSFEFYQVEGEEWVEIAFINSSSNRLLDLALLMRFDPDLIEWKSTLELTNH